MAVPLESSAPAAGANADAIAASSSSRVIPADQRKESSSSSVRPLPADRLYRRADVSGLSFATTAELQPVDGLIGQKRALDAINFGTRIDKPGFNLFVIGPHGARMQEAVKAVLLEEARTRPSPSDWAYVNNF